MKRFIFLLGQVGTLLLSGFGGFYNRIAPPQDRLRFWPGYASIVAGIVFIIVMIAVRSKKARFVILWISIVPTVVCPAIYYNEYLNRTSPYGSARVTCGTVYTSKGSDYSSKHPEETREEIIKDFAGQTAEIWTEESINRSELILGLSYSAALGFLAFSVLTAFQQAKLLKSSSR